MANFAFIFHPIKFDDIFFGLGTPPVLNALVKAFPRSTVKSFFRNVPPFSLFQVKKICSLIGNEVDGDGIVLPLLPDQFVSEPETLILDKIVAAGKLAEKRGASIIGLAGFTSIIGNEGHEVSEQLSIAVTSGNTFTASLATRGLLKASRIMGIRLEEASIAVIGATGDIGSACATILADLAPNMILAARNEERLEEFAKKLRKEKRVNVEVTKYPKDAARKADLILTATSAITTIIEPKHLKPGAVLCDVALPANIAKEVSLLRDDILVFEGGLARIPFPERARGKNWHRLFPGGIIHGCLGETIILALEGRLEDFSVGRGNITKAKIDEIERLSRKHGFELAPLSCAGIAFSDARIKDIAKRRSQDRGVKVFNISKLANES